MANVGFFIESTVYRSPFLFFRCSAAVINLMFVTYLPTQLCTFYFPFVCLRYDKYPLLPWFHHRNFRDSFRVVLRGKLRHIARTRSLSRPVGGKKVGRRVDWCVVPLRLLGYSDEFL